MTLTAAKILRERYLDSEEVDALIADWIEGRSWCDVKPLEEEDDG